jgi:hypothetical protein
VSKCVSNVCLSVSKCVQVSHTGANDNGELAVSHVLATHIRPHIRTHIRAQIPGPMITVSLQ